MFTSGSPARVVDTRTGEDASRIRTQPGVMARIRSVALNILRANGVQNISLALYANAVSFDQLLALGHCIIRTEWPWCNPKSADSEPRLANQSPIAYHYVINIMAI